MFGLFKKKLKKYLIMSTNTDMLMLEETDPVVFVWAENDKEMYAILNTMSPADPTKFLIFEECVYERVIPDCS